MRSLGWLALGVLALDAYHEKLTVELLDGDQVLVHWDFHTAGPDTGDHRDLFPAAVAQVLQNGTEAFTATLTRGRWEAPWGLPPPPGATLVARGPGHGTAWARLTHALGGLFGASLDSLAREHPSFRWIEPVQMPGAPDTWVNTLPYEATCTENLTPFLKLLPCHGHAGIGALLQAYTLAAAPFLSLGLRAERTPGP